MRRPEGEFRLGTASRSRRRLALAADDAPRDDPSRPPSADDDEIDRDDAPGVQTVAAEQADAEDAGRQPAMRGFATEESDASIDAAGFDASGFDAAGFDAPHFDAGDANPPHFEFADFAEADVEATPEIAPPPPPAIPMPRLVLEPARTVSRPRIPRELLGDANVRRIRRLLEGSTPVMWVFTGDELTQGGTQSAKRRTFPEIFGERVRLELKRFLDVVVNTGIAGDRAVTLAKNLEQRVLRFRPDVVSITLGLNDALRGPAARAEFGKRVGEILAEVKAEGAIPLLHVPNRFSLDRSPAHADLPAYVELLRTAAREAETPLLDHWTDWRAHPESRGWLAEDRVHPNARGHRAMARLLFAALGVYDDESPCCGD
ncbi:MAG: SGNH/GDSL hydrolase family protein [Planctomycetaceae bacterium]